jgi:hypothetical protein
MPVHFLSFLLHRLPEGSSYFDAFPVALLLLIQPIQKYLIVLAYLLLFLLFNTPLLLLLESLRCFLVSESIENELKVDGRV